MGKTLLLFCIVSALFSNAAAGGDPLGQAIDSSTVVGIAVQGMKHIFARGVLHIPITESAVPRRVELQLSERWGRGRQLDCHSVRFGGRSRVSARLRFGSLPLYDVIARLKVEGHCQAVLSGFAVGALAGYYAPTHNAFRAERDANGVAVGLRARW